MSLLARIPLQFLAKALFVLVYKSQRLEVSFIYPRISITSNEIPGTDHPMTGRFVDVFGSPHFSNGMLIGEPVLENNKLICKC